MSSYIATFYSHFDAITFFDTMKAKNVTAKLMPVPRKFSASCGTCVYFEFEGDLDFSDCRCEIEAIHAAKDLNISI